MRDNFESRDDASRCWEKDPEPWRDGTGPLPTGGCWPQLDAGPVYWMWLAVLEAERGITS